MSDRRASADVVALEIEWLDRLRAKLDPHLDPAIATLVELAGKGKRESVRLKAAAKLIDVYAKAVGDAAALKLETSAGHYDDDRVRVVLVDRAQLPQATAILAAHHQASRKAAQDVS